MILLRVELYLEGAEVHVFIMEVSTFCQFGKMAFGEVKSEKCTDSLVSCHTLLQKYHLKKDTNEGKSKRVGRNQSMKETQLLRVVVTTVCVHVWVFVLTFSHF